MKQYVISVLSFLVFFAALHYVVGLPLLLSIGFILLLLMHELGHVIALRRLGKTIKGLYFLPLIGAFVVSPSEFTSKNEIALFKYSGPLAGAFGVLATLVGYLIFEDPIFLILTVLGGAINVINMVPMAPLDGHGVLVGVHRNMRYLGILLLAALGVFVLQDYALSLFLFIIFILSSYDDDEPATGFQVHEAIIAVGCLLAFVYLMRTNQIDRIYGFAFYALSLWVFARYLKVTLLDKQKTAEPSKPTIPLSEGEKRDWGIRWFLLMVVLTIATYFAYHAYSIT